jgi:hypothetical protein
MSEHVLRFLLWRTLGLIAAIGGVALVAWFLGGGPGRLLRGHAARQASPHFHGTIVSAAAHEALVVWRWKPLGVISLLQLLIMMVLLASVVIALTRVRSRHRRRYVRLQVEPYRGDHADADALLRMFEALHKRLLCRWWRRLLSGQPSLALEVHHGGNPNAPAGWLAVSCPSGLERMVEAALRAAYPSCQLRACEWPVADPPAVLRLKKQREFVMRSRVLDRFEQERDHRSTACSL